MNKLEEIVAFNREFVANKEYEEYRTSKLPNKKMIILSCMDTRLTELLPKAMNIKNGDAKIIKNAGAMITHPFGSAIRSMIVAIYEFQAEDIFVVGHHGCGMSNVDTSLLLDKIESRGISKKTISMIHSCGIDVKSWLRGFDSVEDSIKESVKMIRNHPLIPKNVNVYGLIIDPYTGELEVVTK